MIPIPPPSVRANPSRRSKRTGKAGSRFWVRRRHSGDSLRFRSSGVRLRHFGNRHKVHDRGKSRARFRLHRSPVHLGADPQLLFDFAVEIADQERRHTGPLYRDNASIDIEDINDIENWVKTRIWCAKTHRKHRLLRLLCTKMALNRLRLHCLSRVCVCLFAHAPKPPRALFSIAACALSRTHDEAPSTMPPVCRSRIDRHLSGYSSSSGLVL